VQDSKKTAENKSKGSSRASESSEDTKDKSTFNQSKEEAKDASSQNKSRGVEFKNRENKGASSSQ